MEEYNNMDTRRGNRGYSHRSNDRGGGRGGQQIFERPPTYTSKPPVFVYRGQSGSASFMSSNPSMPSSNRPNRQRTNKQAHIAMVNGQALVTNQAMVAGQLTQNGCPPMCPTDSTNIPEQMNCSVGDWQAQCTVMPYINNNLPTMTEWCSAQDPYCVEYKPLASRLSSPPAGLRVTASPGYQQESYNPQASSFVPYNCPPATLTPPQMYGAPWTPPPPVPLFVPPRWNSPIPPVYAMPVTQQWQIGGMTYFSPPTQIFYPQENGCVAARDGVMSCMECDQGIPVAGAAQTTNNIMPLPQECTKETVVHYQSATNTVPQDMSARNYTVESVRQETSQSTDYFAVDAIPHNHQMPQSAESVPYQHETSQSTGYIAVDTIPHEPQSAGYTDAGSVPSQLSAGHVPADIMPHNQQMPQSAGQTNAGSVLYQHETQLSAGLTNVDPVHQQMPQSAGQTNAGSVLYQHETQLSAGQTNVEPIHQQMPQSAGQTNAGSVPYQHETQLSAGQTNVEPIHQQMPQSAGQSNARSVPHNQQIPQSTGPVPYQQQTSHCDGSTALPFSTFPDHEPAQVHSNIVVETCLPSPPLTDSTRKYSYAAAATNRYNVKDLLDAIAHMPAAHSTDTQHRGCPHWNGKALAQHSTPAQKLENQQPAPVIKLENQLPDKLENPLIPAKLEDPTPAKLENSPPENLENSPEPSVTQNQEPAPVEAKNESNQNLQENIQQDHKAGSDENPPAVWGQIHRYPNVLQTEPGEDKPRPVTLNFKEIFAQSEKARLEKLAAMTPIIKDTYVENVAVARMSPQEADRFRAVKNGIKVHYIDMAELTPSVLVSSKAEPEPSGPKMPIPNPIRTFEEGFGMYPEIMEEIAKQGFTEPSPIQCQLWPCAMKGMDVVGIAQTGSGKTLAFLLPAMIHIQRQVTPREQRKSPTVLVLAPTRELALQIDREVKKYSYKNIRSVCVYGGASRREQIDALNIQTEIVIATPGRLNDLVQAGELDLTEVSFLVLDDAAALMDSGFEPHINKALLRVRGDRQTMLTSATWPESVRRFVKKYTKNPVMVVEGTTDIRAVMSIKQNIIFLDSPDDRFDWIVNFLQKMSREEKAIIFVGNKSLADHLSSELTLGKVSVQTIHGSLCQEDSEQAIADMQSGTANILVATDVASRGINIENVNHVVNHQFPNSVEQYVHRIGRTGRAGKLGESHTFIGRKDWSSAKQLIDILEHAAQGVPKELRDMAERFENRRPSEGRGRRRGREGFDRQWDGLGFGGGFSGGRGRDRYESPRPPRNYKPAPPVPTEVFDWGCEPPKIDREERPARDWGNRNSGERGQRGGGNWERNSGGGGEEWAPEGRDRARGQWNKNTGCRYPN